MSNDDLIVKIKADIRSLQSGLRQAAREADIAGKKMGQAIEKSSAREALDGVNRAAVSAANSLKGMRGVIATLAISKLGKDAFAAAVGFDALEASLNVVLGSGDKATAAIADMRSQAERLGINVVTLTQGFSKFAAAANGTALEGAKARDVFLAVNEASARMGLSSEQTAGALRALEQIMSKGSVQAEELRGQLGERIPGAFNMAARAMGVTTQELNDLLKQGKVASDDFLPKFAAELRKTFSTTETTRIATMRSEFERVKNVINEIQIELGTPLARAFANAGQEFLKFAEVRKVEMMASEFRRAADAVDYYRSRVDAAKKLPLTGLVEDMSRALRQAEADLEKATAARDKFIQGAIGKAIGISAPKPIAGPAVDVPIRTGAPEDLEALRKEREKQKKLEEERQKALASMASADRKIVEGIRERVATETQIETMRHSASRAALEAINNEAIVSSEEKARLIEQLEIRHAATLASIDARKGEDAARQSKERVSFLQQAMTDSETAGMSYEEAERARLEAEHLNRLHMLEDAKDEELALLGEKHAIREQFERDHLLRLSEIQADGLNSQFSFLRFAKSREQMYLASIGNQALSAWSGQSKKLFEINKSLSLAQAAVALPTAVLESYKNAGGYPFGIAAAAAMTAVGLANIASIKNAKYGGGSSPPVTGAAAAGGGVVGDTNAPGSAHPPRMINLTLVGGQFSQQQIRELVTQINEAYSDGAPRK